MKASDLDFESIKPIDLNSETGIKGNTLFHLYLGSCVRRAGYSGSPARRRYRMGIDALHQGTQGQRRSYALAQGRISGSERAYHHNECRHQGLGCLRVLEYWYGE